MADIGQGKEMTELIWDGKYDKDGRRVAPLRVALPFQTVETANESVQQRQTSITSMLNGQESEWRNRLIWGDKKYVLPSLLEEFAGKVNLIYTDPPFNVGANFSFTATIPDNPDTDQDESTRFVKEPSVIEMKAYRDTWGRGLDSYLQWFYEAVVFLRELLAENGSLYVHLDWHVGHYAKTVLDEVFGNVNFRNEIIWQKIRTTKAQSIGFGNVHDVIFVYTKTENAFFDNQYKSFDENYVASHYKKDETGKLYRTVSLLQRGQGKVRRFGKKKLEPPAGMHWIWTQERIDEAMAMGLIRFTSNGRPEKVQFLDDMKGDIVDDLWTDIYPINSQALEALDYPTQKPEALLERIIKASSNDNDLVLDCFSGSGTTAAVAEKLNRRWIACDLGRFAIHTTRKRFLSVENVRPFVIQNLGKYERQAWQKAEFGDGAEALSLAYRKFILDLYKAKPLTGYNWLHGLKGGRMVHVGGVDSPVSIGDVTNIVAEFKKAVGKGANSPTTNGIDVLGWDFAFELNEVAKQQAQQANIRLRFVRIPSEVLDKKAVEQGDIRFFELAALSVDVKKAGRKVTLTLSDFVIHPDDVPADVQKAISHWSQWIDYWAVDWDNKGDTFHNEWQTYRTRKDSTLEKSTFHEYQQAGEYAVVVKVIDILGNDTTKTLKVKLG
ncbi:MAG: site-specific DNA-methyltransferase [Bacteroidetes bacterium]|nr:site-specific DNA-methyltransferase [Bacteroidota bacterium]